MNAKILTLAVLLAIPLSSQAFERKDAELAMTEATTAVQGAERTDAAPADLTVAHDMIASAQGAYDHRRWQESVFFAENARVDADLAGARSRQRHAEAATLEMERTVKSLRDQVNSNGGQP